MLSFFFLFGLAAAQCKWAELKFKIDGAAVVPEQTKQFMCTDKAGQGKLHSGFTESTFPVGSCGVIKSKNYDCSTKNLKCKEPSKDSNGWDPEELECSTIAQSSPSSPSGKFKKLSQKPMSNCKTTAKNPCLSTFYYQDSSEKVYIIKNGCTKRDNMGKKLWCAISGGADTPVLCESNTQDTIAASKGRTATWGNCEDSCTEGQEEIYDPSKKMSVEMQISAAKTDGSIEYYTLFGGISVTILTALSAFTLYRHCQKPADEYIALIDDHSEL